MSNLIPDICERMEGIWERGFILYLRPRCAKTYYFRMYASRKCNNRCEREGKTWLCAH